MFHVRVLFSLFLISLQLGTVSPAAMNRTGFLLSVSATDLFPVKLFTINRFLDTNFMQLGAVLPSDGSLSLTPALPAVPTKTPASTSAKLTPTPTPKPTAKPAAPTPLPLGTTQSESAGDLVFDYPDAAPVNTDTSTYTLLVNKEYTLSSKYIPFMVEPNVEIYHKGTNERRYLQPVAATALEEMFAAAKKDGLKLVLRCGFRSYALQRSIYAYALKTYGYYEASRFHALPGTSEHQTGLAVDLCCKATNYDNNYDFLKTKEYAWMLKNAHKYGWILRYPENKETITGYNFEPWHFRYVGVELATYLKELDITLEEYYGAPSTTYLQGVPKEFWSYMSQTEYEYMLESVEAYAQDPSGRTQPTPSPKPRASKNPSPTPTAEDQTEPELTDATANGLPTPTPAMQPTDSDTSDTTPFAPDVTDEADAPDADVTNAAETSETTDTTTLFSTDTTDALDEADAPDADVTNAAETPETADTTTLFSTDTTDALDEADAPEPVDTDTPEAVPEPVPALAPDNAEPKPREDTDEP